jgi:16S rRNA (guanine527-N7)-methyltransferase
VGPAAQAGQGQTVQVGVHENDGHCQNAGVRPRRTLPDAGRLIMGRDRPRRHWRRNRGRNPAPAPKNHPDLMADAGALAKALRPYCLELHADAQSRLVRFAEELLQWNDRLNLLSRPDAPNVIRKHCAASLGVLLVTRPGPRDRWIDVGSGAGFPGLVLKIVRPDLDMSLLESARKRCIFLENTVRTLELGRVPVHSLRAETLISRGEEVGRYSVMTVRAVTTLEGTVSMFSPLVAPSGRIVTFKGPAWREEVEQAQERGVLKAHGLSLESVTRIPWTAGHLIVLRKSR